MPTAQQLSMYSQTALASYAVGLVPDRDNTAAYLADKVRMVQPQATKFNATWNVLQQSTFTVDGFSAVLLQNRVTGEKVLSIAGTDPASPADLITDVVNIWQYGTVLFMPQYNSLESFYAQLVSSGKLGADEQVVVAGHSLGGFLTQAFTARHASVVAAAYTYNAPGFGTTEAMLGFLGLTDTAAAAARIANVQATDGVSLTIDLGTQLGASQAVRIEADAVNPLQNHSLVTLGDALAVQALYGSLQPALSIAAIGTHFVSAGYRDRRLEDALDALRTVFIGSASNDANKTPKGDRDFLYANLYSLQNDSGFKAMSGQVQLVRAGVDLVLPAQAASNTALAYRYALLELLPFAVVANTDAKNQTMYGAYTQRLSLFDAVTGQGELTNAWLADRAAMTEWLLMRNQLDTDVVAAGPGVQGAHFKDIASGIEFDLGIPSQGIEKRQIAFGGELANFLTGKKLADRFYGGAGGDTLNGLGGNDYLEGGSGVDTYQFDGNFGTDTVLDTGGQGGLMFDGMALAGVMQRVKGSSNVWQDASGLYVFVWQPDGNGRGDLVIGKRKSVTDSKLAGVVSVRDFANGELGLTLLNGDRPPGPGGTAGQINVYLTNPLIPGTTQFNPAITPDFQSNGVREYSHPAAVAHWVNAPLDGGQVITLGDGADYVDVARPYSGPGNAQWTPGPGLDEDYVATGGGNDTIRTGYGSDYIAAGAGDDQIFAAGYGALQNHDAADAVGGDVVDAGDGVDGLWGSVGSDILFGGDGADGFMGMEGNDLLVGGSGDDNMNGDGAYTTDPVLFAQVVGALLGYTTGGDDVLFGGAGVDRLMGGVGADALDGGAGDDKLFGDTDSYYVAGNMAWIPGEYHADDLLDGGAGNDILLGGGGSDQLLGGAGDDTIFGDQYNSQSASISLQYHGDDWIDGGDGNDTLNGDGGDDTIDGGAGYNTLTGGAGNDSLTSSGVYDTFDGGAGTDTYVVAPTQWSQVTLLGFNAEDSLVVSMVSDAATLVRGSGAINGLTVRDSATGASVIFADFFSQLGSGQTGISAVTFGNGVQWSGQQLVEKSRPVATEGNDDLVAYATEGLLIGLGGDDRLTGAGGDHEFRGGTGKDTIDSRDGGAIIDYDRGDGGDVIYLAADAAKTNVVRFGVGIAPTDVAVRAIYAGYDASGENFYSVSLQLDGSQQTYVSVHNCIGERHSASSDLLDRVEFAGGAVWDQQELRRQLTLGTEANDVILAVWQSAAPIQGLGGNDAIYGTSGNDVLEGGAGDDGLCGKAGDDVYLGGPGNDLISDDAIPASNDTYRFNLGDGRDTVSDHMGNDTVEFGAGISQSQVATHIAGYGQDLSLVLSSGDSIALGYAVNGDRTGQTATENLKVKFANGSTWDWTRIEQELAKPQTGTQGADRLWGYANNNDVFYGVGGDDALQGGAGSDVLDGGAGNDSLAGGIGNDVYLFGKTDGNDGLDESYDPDAGSTKLNVLRFKAGVSPSEVTLRRNYNHLEFSIAGTSDKITAYWFYESATGPNAGLKGPIQQVAFADGTAWDLVTLQAMLPGNVVTGTAAADALMGTATADRISALDGDDSLAGGAGNDWLDGGAGTDAMAGGAGDDVFVADAASDSLTELANDGNDTVRSDVTWILGANLENLVLTGIAAIDGTGNALGNRLFGNGATNLLDGGAGNDVLAGGAGNDTYVVKEAGDAAFELAGEGTDLVKSSLSWTLGANLEKLTLTGSAVVNGTGNELGNVLNGNSAANVLTGGEGNDTYSGAGGNDTFSDTSLTSNETYKWGSGVGTDTLTDSGGSLDHVDLFAGITKSQLKFVRNASNLEFSIVGAGDKLVINNWFVSSANQIEEFRLADGDKVLASEVAGLLSAMAAFSAPSGVVASALEHQSFRLPIEHMAPNAMLR